MKDFIIMVVVVLVIVILGFWLASVWNNHTLVTTGAQSDVASSSPSATAPVSAGPESREVVFPADDGYMLSGTLSIPNPGSPVKGPAIVLVHQNSADRHEFDAFVSTLLNDGYAVLAYDSRGFGQSVHANGTASLNDWPKDVAGAVSYVGSIAEVDPNAVGVIGASVGANAAFVASGSNPLVKVAVALSPTNPGAKSPLMGAGIKNFSAHNILVASDDKEKATSDAVYAVTKEVRERKVYAGAGHGVELLKSVDAVNDILNFLARFLDVKG